MKEYRYEREKAVEYAHKWAYSRNSKYLDFESLGGDCTNFASQSIFAGSGIMNYTPVFGWFYIDSRRRTASWTGVEFLKNFLFENKSEGPFGEEVPISKLEIGDIIQLSFDDKIFKHTPVVVEVGNPPGEKNILLAAHSFDTDYKRLADYDYMKYRCIHIKGVRK